MKTLLLAMLLVGCAAPTSYQLPPDAEVAISPLFSAGETEQVMAGIDAWQTASAGKLHLRVHVGGDGYLTIAPADLSERNDAGVTTYDHDGPGHTYMQLDAAVLDKLGADGRPWLQATTMHELGHALGLGHKPGGLMNATVAPVASVDADTLALFNQNYP